MNIMKWWCQMDKFSVFVIYLSSNCENICDHFHRFYFVFVISLGTETMQLYFAAVRLFEWRFTNCMSTESIMWIGWSESSFKCNASIIEEKNFFRIAILSHVNCETSSSPAQTLFAVKCHEERRRNILFTRVLRSHFASSIRLNAHCVNIRLISIKS